MMKKFDCILLIDDDEASNFIHNKILSKADIAKKIIIMESAYDALDYLKSDAVEIPDLVLLDINMPGMDGWDFIEEYKLLDKSKQAPIVMVTTSMNPDDKIKSQKIKEIKNFMNKPLSADRIFDIMTEHFT